MSEAEQKIEAVKSVLRKRADILRRIISKQGGVFYEGKLEGYQQAIELLGESLASIRIEL